MWVFVPSNTRNERSCAPRRSYQEAIKKDPRTQSTEHRLQNTLRGAEFQGPLRSVFCVLCAVFCILRAVFSSFPPTAHIHTESADAVDDALRAYVIGHAIILPHA